jgi:hypothetical protein
MGLINFFKKLLRAPKTIKAALKIPKIVNATYFKDVLTIKYDDDTIREYSGSCTVWHHYPMMERCSTFREGELCDIWKYIQAHGNPYPTAHEKTAYEKRSISQELDIMLEEARESNTYTEKEVENLLEVQRGNCYVAILSETRDENLSLITNNAPEPAGGKWRKK